jgi:hypothetical protein
VQQEFNDFFAICAETAEQKNIDIFAHNKSQNIEEQTTSFVQLLKNKLSSRTPKRAMMFLLQENQQCDDHCDPVLAPV